MQGKGTEDHAKLSFLLTLCILFALIAAGLISCTQWDKEEKDYTRKYDAQFKYKVGDIVYLKPDSTVGVITDKILWSEDKIVYTVRYSTKLGKLEYLDSYEQNIFGKKY